MRRIVWILFVPAILGLGFVVVLFSANFYKMLNLFRHDAFELEFRVGKTVAISALVFSVIVYLVGWALRRHKEQSETGTMFREIASIMLAIAFGGFFAVAHGSQIWWAYVVVGVPYALWVARIEWRRPQKKERRRLWRLAAWMTASAVTCMLIHFASFS